MTSTIRFIVICALLCLTSVVHAEGNCPQGYYPIGSSGPSGPQGCAPIPNAQGGQSQPSRQPPAPRWETRWGSIAIDDGSSNAGLGTAQGSNSKALAESSALAMCEQKGGNGCRTFLSFYNQCGVVIVAIDEKKSQGYVRGHTAETVEKASIAGMNDCRAAGATNCQVYYSACSLPERIQ